ncbi:MAG: hypothetical protein WC707_04270 [Candidatus Babeliaceae bacterium]|jgi:hypothetical protein
MKKVILSVIMVSMVFSPNVHGVELPAWMDQAFHSMMSNKPVLYTLAGATAVSVLVGGGIGYAFGPRQTVVEVRDAGPAADVHTECKEKIEKLQKAETTALQKITDCNASFKTHQDEWVQEKSKLESQAASLDKQLGTEKTKCRELSQQNTNLVSANVKHVKSQELFESNLKAVKDEKSVLQGKIAQKDKDLEAFGQMRGELDQLKIARDALSKEKEGLEQQKGELEGQLQYREGVIARCIAILTTFAAETSFAKKSDAEADAIKRQNDLLAHYEKNAPEMNKQLRLGHGVVSYGLVLYHAATKATEFGALAKGCGAISVNLGGDGVLRRDGLERISFSKVNDVD